MPSQARAAFENNRKDVERLMEIHGDLAGDTPGRKHGVEVLNKSAIVLMCAVWEAYCEDLAAEAVEHLVRHANDATTLPKALRRTIAVELQGDRNEPAVWALAGSGWTKLLRSRLVDITERPTGRSIRPSPKTSKRSSRRPSGFATYPRRGTGTT
jgi:RiboL-PSP-HEPN